MASFLYLLAPAVALIAYLVYSSVVAYLRLRQFPGPRIAAWTDWWYVRLSCTGRLNVLFGEQCDKYGKLDCVMEIQAKKKRPYGKGGHKLSVDR